MSILKSRCSSMDLFKVFGVVDGVCVLGYFVFCTVMGRAPYIKDFQSIPAFWSDIFVLVYPPALLAAVWFGMFFLLNVSTVFSCALFFMRSSYVSYIVRLQSLLLGAFTVLLVISASRSGLLWATMSAMLSIGMLISRIIFLVRSRDRSIDWIFGR